MCVFDCVCLCVRERACVCLSVCVLCVCVPSPLATHQVKYVYFMIQLFDCLGTKFYLVECDGKKYQKKKGLRVEMQKDNKEPYFRYPSPGTVFTKIAQQVFVEQKISVSNFITI